MVAQPGYNSLIWVVFYSYPGLIVILGVCFVLVAVGLSINGDYQVKNNDNVILFRKPWTKVMAVNVVVLFLIWMSIKTFVMGVPIGVSLCITAFFGWIGYIIFKYGLPETTRFDLQEHTCWHTHGWFKRPRIVRMSDILGLDLRTCNSEGMTFYVCRLKWRSGLFGWSEIGYFNKRQPALDFMEKLSQKLQLPLSVIEYSTGKQHYQ